MSLAVCPACPVIEFGAVEPARARIILSVPSAHCASCMAGIERVLAGVAGVRSARVNLSLKRVLVDAGAGVSGEDLALAVSQAGWPAQELDAGLIAPADSDAQAKALLMRLGVAGFAMMNLMLLSVAIWSGAVAETRVLFHLISAMIAVPTIAFAGQPFFASALAALRGRRLNMDVPISLAILLATGMSLFETFNGGQDAYFDAAVSLTFFLLAGRYLEARTRGIARSAAATLSALTVPKALLADGRMVEAKDLAPGDMIRVLPGLRLPADGVVVNGESELDCSTLTGESAAVFAGQGMALDAGALNLTGVLDLRVTRAGADTALSRLAELVSLAETSRNKYTSLADQAARIYAPGVHALALLTFVGWMVATGDLRHALNVAIAVLIITCPCALGLAVPAVVTAASGRLFRRGFVLRSATALERLAEVDHVVFDKTGTLTSGAPRVVGDLPTGRVASVALALAQASAHPLSRALALALDGVVAANVTGLHEVPGHGVEGVLGGEVVRLGRPDWVGGESVGSSVGLLVGGEVTLIRFADTAREGALQAVGELGAVMPVTLLSGDTDAIAVEFGASLGISDARGGLLPADKVAVIEGLKAQGKHVLMIGDGLNDTAALAAAHVSMAPGSALDAARSLADIVLLGDSFAGIASALATARSARRLILQNFAVAALYNTVSIPLAVLGFASPL
ncbi:MAG: heavy metal translocating P-type ATPase, partial [Deltaproteobacteria bacterium]